MVDINRERQRAIALAQAKQAQQQSIQQPEFQTGSPTSALLNGIVQGATFGFADELAAGLASPFQAGYDALQGNGFDLGQGYNTQLDNIRGQEQQLAEQYPVMNVVGNIGGGLYTGMGLAKAGLTMLRGSAPLWQNTLAGGLEGLGYGALAGFGGGDDMQGRLSGALMGGAGGTLIGGAVPALANAGGAAVRAVQSNRAFNQAASDLGTDPNALRVLEAATRNDDIAGEGLANIQRAGQEGMLADMGPSAVSQLDLQIQKAGPGARVAQNRIQERLQRDSQAFTDALDSTLGAPRGLGTIRSEISESTRGAVSDAYKPAYSSPIDYSSPQGRAIEELITRVPPKQLRLAIERATDEMIYDGLPNPQIIASIADDGTVSFAQKPNVMQLDYIKRAFDRIANDGKDPLTGAMTSEGRFASRIARDIRDATKAAVPAYGDALRIAADPISRSNAVQLGYDMFKRSVSRDQMATSLSRMTQPEKDAVAEGVRSQIDDTMARVQRNVSTAQDTEVQEALRELKALSSRDSRDKISLVIGDEKATSLFDELDRITRTFELSSQTVRGAQTYGRQAAAKAQEEITGGDGIISTLAQGRPLNAGQRLIQTLTGETSEARAVRNAEIGEQIARILTTQGPEAMEYLLAISQLQNKGQLGAKIAEEFAQKIRSTGGGLALGLTQGASNAF